MLSLRFQAKQHAGLLAKREKNGTVRLGGVYAKYLKVQPSGLQWERSCGSVGVLGAGCRETG